MYLAIGNRHHYTGLRFVALNFTVFFLIHLHIPSPSHVLCAQRRGPSLKLTDLYKVVGPKGSKNHPSFLKKGITSEVHNIMNF